MYCDCDVGGHVELNSGGTLTNTKLQVGDGVTPMTAHLNNKGSFPASGAIEVDTNSVLTIRVGGTNVTGLDKKVPIVVRKDGRIITAIASIFDANNSDITLDGGIISVSPYGSVTGDSGLYFKVPTLTVHISVFAMPMFGGRLRATSRLGAATSSTCGITLQKDSPTTRLASLR